MRILKLVLVVLTLAGGIAFGAMGDLLGSFPNPAGRGNRGLAADHNYLYSFCQKSSTSYPVYVIYKSTGSLSGSYPMPLEPVSSNYGCHGMGYEAGAPGGYLHINNYYTRTAGKFVASSGSLMSTWTWPSGIRYALCVDNDKETPGTAKGIWQSDDQGNFFYSTTTGSPVSSFHTEYLHNVDLTWDYKNDFIWLGNTVTESVYGMTTAGSVLYSWRVPTNILNPTGVAYYGEYLYVSTTGGSPEDYIWIYHCPICTAVHPSSFGKIKTLFG